MGTLSVTGPWVSLVLNTGIVITWTIGIYSPPNGHKYDSSTNS